MPGYRLALTLSFFFKFFLHVAERRKISLKGISGLDAESTLPAFSTTQVYREIPSSQSAIDPIGRALKHASGEKHTTGEAIYTTDIKQFGAAHLVLVLSPVAHGRLKSIDFKAALKLRGVVGVVGVRDVPGKLCLGWYQGGDTPIFADGAGDELHYHGQPIAGVVAEDHETARRAANLVRMEIEPLPAVVTIEEALNERSFFFDQPHKIHSKLVEKEGKEVVNEPSLPVRSVEGCIHIGGQEHFYLETHNCIVVPGEGDEYEVHSSTQAANDVQGDVSIVLAVPRHKIKVSVKRIGGGFGGKESTSSIFACAAAVAARKYHRPVRLYAERFDDMACTGNRHPFRFDYKLSMDSSGRFVDYQLHLYNNCGYSLDLSKGVLERAMTHADSVYKFGNADFEGRLCRTNLASNTAFRGFGAPQSMFATETAIKHAAEELFGGDLDDVDVLRERNFYAEGDCTPFGMHLHQCNIRRCWEELVEFADYKERKQAVEKFNSQSRYKKRGIYLMPTKFGIGFGHKLLNQAGALVHVYTDGSVLVSHAGMEMGQGLHTKILQIAARCLEVQIDRVHIAEMATDKVPNASPTAASVGSDLNGLAVQDACQKLLFRLEPFKEADPKAGWESWVKAAYTARVHLSATGFATIHSESVDFVNGKGAEMFGYCVYGTAAAEVEVDCLTGDHRTLRADVVMDVGESLNPAIDIGQIEGAFTQGYGVFTMEELKIRPDGTRLTRGPGTYKIPSADDTPRQFNVKLLRGSSNAHGIFSSKAVGEPPLFLGSSVMFAIREAIRAYRIQNGQGSGYFRLDAPATPERIRMACEDGIVGRIRDNATEKERIRKFTPWVLEKL